MRQSTQVLAGALAVASVLSAACAFAPPASASTESSTTTTAVTGAATTTTIATDETPVQRQRAVDLGLGSATMTSIAKLEKTVLGSSTLVPADALILEARAELASATTRALVVRARVTRSLPVLKRIGAQLRTDQRADQLEATGARLVVAADSDFAKAQADSAELADLAPSVANATTDVARLAGLAARAAASDTTAEATLAQARAVVLEQPGISNVRLAQARELVARAVSDLANVKQWSATMESLLHASS